MGKPDFIGIKDASIHGVGGIIIGHHRKCKPTMFRVEWPPGIKQAVLCTNAKQGGYLTNSDLKMAGLLFLWMVMEEVCDITRGTQVALFSDNLPMVSSVRWMAARSSQVAGQLIRALALCLKVCQVSPLTPLHNADMDNAIMDVPSRLFGSNPQWHCKQDHEFLILFNKLFPLPSQNSWTNYHISSKIHTRVISVLRMKSFQWTHGVNFPSTGNTLKTLGGLCPASGSGPFLTGHPIHHTGLMPQRFCCQGQKGWIWMGTYSQGQHGFNGSLRHWQRDRFGLQHQPRQT